ncbi:MAG: alanine racemase [Actinomycetota bacterium]|nr:alanine racemase [Actinomycetota bacterium]
MTATVPPPEDRQPDAVPPPDTGLRPDAGRPSGPAMPAGLPSCAVIDLQAVRDNVATLVRRAGPASVMAVVKADAYGHGMLPVARAALGAGAGWLGVTQISEALALRSAGLSVPVLAWLTVPGDAYGPAVAAGIDLGISRRGILDEVARAAAAHNVTARVHLKIDTGLHRNGAVAAHWPDLVDHALKLQAEGCLRVVGAFSHLALSDVPGHPLTDSQLAAFRQAVDLAERRGAELEVRHLANSAAVLTRPDTHFDLVRPGLAVYGLSPLPQVAGPAELGLRPAMTLMGRIAQVKRVPAGAGVSYGHTYTTPAPTTLALIPLGYGDGLPRHASGTGPVLLRGRRHRIAGRICMDQSVLDLADPENRTGVCSGDVAVLFGDGLDGGPTAEDWARAAGTISYEIVTRLGSRVPRIHRALDPAGGAGS